MKILWIARTCPFPANDGEKLRVFNLLKALAARHELTVIYREIDDDERAGADVLEGICRGGVHAVRVPRPRGMLDKLRWVLPFVFSRYPVALCTVYFESIRRELARVAEVQTFDIVQVEHSSLAIYLDRVRFAGAPATVLTMHNIDHVRNARVLANTPWGPTKLYHWFNQLRFKPWELGVMARFDRVVAMSEVDRAMMLADLPTLPVSVVPNGVDVSAVAFALAPAASRQVIFVASMDSEANHDGAMFFLRQVWPLLQRQCPDAKVAFVGRNPLPELLAAHDGLKVVVTGKVDDVMGYYRGAAVAVVPLRSGGGTRLKILEAMAAGTPVVSTSVGCEGLDVTDGLDILIADDAAAFAMAVQRLLDDPGMRSSFAQQARATVEQVYDWPLVSARQDAAYRDAQALRA